MSLSRNDLLGHASSEESDSDQGYDSEAAEISKSSKVAAPERPQKRRKLSHSPSEEDVSATEVVVVNVHTNGAVSDEDDQEEEESQDESPRAGRGPVEAAPKQPLSNGEVERSKTVSKEKKKKGRGKESRPGVIYLSSVPPHLRPSALRNLLEQRGFSPITRLFLAPITKDASKKTSSTSKARRSYGEGWIEFSSHKTGKLCAQTLNATPIGGKKGGYYRDDLWNMKYLRGMGWEDLMEGVRGEKREEVARRDDERRQIQREAKMFLEGVEEGKRVEGIREKRKRKGQNTDDSGPKRTFRQFEAQKDKAKNADGLSEEAREVLGKIF